MENNVSNIIEYSSAEMQYLTEGVYLIIGLLQIFLLILLCYLFVRWFSRFMDM